MTTALTQLETAAAIQNPTGSPASASLPTAMVISPSNGNFGSNYYPSSNWTSYLNAFAGLTDVTLSGFTNGEVDANGIWHNGQYYSYTMSSFQNANVTYFKFSPTAASQTQGYMPPITTSSRPMARYSSSLARTWSGVPQAACARPGPRPATRSATCRPPPSRWAAC